MAKLRIKIVAVGIALLVCFFWFLSTKNTEVKNENSIFGRTVFNNNISPGKTAKNTYKITWPADHASHDDFDIEWWYLTANLKDEQGEPYGMQWTLFRFRSLNQSVASEWANDQVFMSHASIHSMSAHWFSEKFARGGVGNAGVNSQPFSAFIDDWEWRNKTDKPDLFPSILRFTANQKNSSNQDLKAVFTLNQTGPFVLHGDKGYSIKSGNGKHASHYYSAPFIDISGQLVFTNSSNQRLTKNVKGQAWYDHEWTSQLLDSQTLGWDWLSLHLDDGSKVMAFRMRLDKTNDYITGSYISASGKQLTLTSDMLHLKPTGMTTVNNKQLPLSWSLNIPNKNVSLQIQTLKPDQYNNASVPYYEGMVNVQGSHSGKGFLELTGY